MDIHETVRFSRPMAMVIAIQAIILIVEIASYQHMSKEDQRTADALSAQFPSNPM